MKRTSNDLGFSLIEIIIATAVLGIVSLGVMQLLKNMHKGQVDVQNSADYASIMQESTLLINNINACRASLIGLTFYGSSIQSTSVTGLELWTVNQAGVRTMKKFYEGQKLSKIVIDKISFSMPDYTSSTNWPIGTNQSFTAELRISGKKSAFGTFRPFQDITKTINVIFDTDASGQSTVKDCSTPPTEADNLFFH